MDFETFKRRKREGRLPQRPPRGTPSSFDDDSLLVIVIAALMFLGGICELVQ